MQSIQNSIKPSKNKSKVIKMNKPKISRKADKSATNIKIDPVTFEVLNHRLLSITEEMGIQYMRCSGSNVLITGNDAASAIMQPDGGLVAVGPYIVTQGNVLPLIVNSTQKLIPKDEISDGDIFICNDPYLGAIHAPDFATVAPIFYKKELVAWIGASGHQLDTGGMDPGGFSVKAVDIHQEGLRMSPVKIVDKGEVREDILGWITNQVRDPLVGLDVKGQIAALNNGRLRILELIETWGCDIFKGVMSKSIAYAEEKLSARLLELPDGVWRDVQFIDHDGHNDAIYKIVCTMTKKGKSIKFDFTGTSPNAKGLINSTYSGLQAAVLSSMYINLCWDIPWNKGVRNCIDIVSEVGTVNNCAYPMPCAMATISAVIVTIDVTWRCLSQLLMCSDKYKDQSMAVWSGTSMAPIFAGQSQHGFQFAATEMSHFGGGGGARSYADGVDTAGIVFNTTPNMPNIEDQEAEYPVLYLFRKHLKDSGGPGFYRGGRSAELAYMVYDAPQGQLEGLFAGTGAEMPNAIGISGGLPGAAIRIARFTHTGLDRAFQTRKRLPSEFATIPGRLEILSCKHVRTPMLQGDVWYHSWQAGGGYGDPLTREPSQVFEDLMRGIISKKAAKDIYGVVISEEEKLNIKETQSLRQSIRKQKMLESIAIDSSQSVLRFKTNKTFTFGNALKINGKSKKITCLQCDKTIGKSGENLLGHLKQRITHLKDAGPVRGQDYDHGRFKLRQLLCPSCGSAIETNLAFEGAPPPSLDLID
jgi:N-methylhydantoinase B